MPCFTVQNLRFLPRSHDSTVAPRTHAKVPLSWISRRVKAELHDSSRTPWSLKRAPALGLKKEGEMLFLHKRGSLSPPTGGTRYRGLFIVSQSQLQQFCLTLYFKLTVSDENYSLKTCSKTQAINVSPILSFVSYRIHFKCQLLVIGQILYNY